MKKFLILALAALMCILALTACGSTESDYEYVKSNGKLVIGITLYEPMNYYDDDGNLIGLDTEFAEYVCAELGLEPEFQTINWEQKESFLKAKNIDCIWNGLTVTEERKENMDFSTTYLTNKQCVVISKDDADKYTDSASLQDAILSAEKESAGESAIKTDENLKNAQYVESNSQSDALLALLAGNVDAIVIDYTMAEATVGNGDYENYMIIEDIELADELYAIGFRVGSDLTEKVNEIINKMVENGKLAEIAEKYGALDRYNEAFGK